MSQRVCLYSIATHLGGGERSLLDLATGLRDRPELGYDPWVLLPKAEGPLVDRLRAQGIAFETLPMPAEFLRLSRAAPRASSTLLGLRSAPALAAYLARLVALLRRRQVKILHSNGIKCHALAAAAGAAAGTKVLWHVRDILDEGGTLWTLRGLRALGRARVVANSSATADAFGARDFVVHNGLDPERFRGDRNDEFRRGSDVVIGIVGVLARWKGQVEFLRMARRLRDRGVDARFVIVGGEIYDTHSPDAGFEKVLRDEAERLELDDRVVFTGFREDAVRAIQGLDILVHASIRPEPFGRVIVEAMASGVPVVASGAGGVPELVQDGISGLIAPPGDVPRLSDAVERLARDPALRERLGTRGRAEFLERLTLDRHVRAIAAVYDAMVMP